ncbi:MAG TPA: alpha amylase C-terminal domain-containing protein, partial [Burkholderiales bacterium]|nr:alpha amylase C-terminal domain-containing protein [Burkholderiales bacterium]
HDYRVGVPSRGYWQELLNSDAESYGGSGMGNLGGVQADAIPYDGYEQSVSLTLPPLGALFFKPA